ncbi:MAG: ABC-F type ribosomal protection protein [Eubacteriales bacterium]|nr:ABC-F type ribosomal protection protein [Eubacteriales bacterium]
MAQIYVSGLTFGYEGSYENIFENVSFCIDTDWKLGLIGRNGKGKTTFLNLLLGKYEYQGSIRTSEPFEYFPFSVEKEMMKNLTIDVMEKIYPDYELWKICCELELLQTDAEILYRPYETLSHGERTKVMLAMLFSRDHVFLLIDESTNHLDRETRETVEKYLRGKKGFILVSHDRTLLDACIDHVLVLERNQIRVNQGNFSSWWENKKREDQFEQAENERLKKEIGKLKTAARQSGMWADKAEQSKIGFDPRKETNRFIGTRAYIGEKSRKMQQHRKNLERRQEKAISEKSQLLKNIEETTDLKMMPCVHHKETYITARNLNLFYGDREVFHDFQLELKRGDRVILSGKNGCGKSSIIKGILTSDGVKALNGFPEEFENEKRHFEGELTVANGLKISYISQDTSGLRGKLDDYIEKIGVSNHLMKSVLRQLDFEREQFDKQMEEYSEGQKKKVLIAGSLLQQAHLYIWDEPLNYIDIFSRMQIEQMILRYQPTMLIVEHDRFFGEKCATKQIVM